jgi:hypothetical protein
MTVETGILRSLFFESSLNAEAWIGLAERVASRLRGDVLSTQGLGCRWSGQEPRGIGGHADLPPPNLRHTCSGNISVPWLFPRCESRRQLGCLTSRRGRFSNMQRRTVFLCLSGLGTKIHGLLKTQERQLVSGDGESRSLMAS